MTEKEERNFEQKMFDVISTQGAAAAAINCMEIAKDYALCKQVKKLNIDDVSKSYTKEDVIKAYDDGFNDGNQRDLSPTG
jgi:hypothetical protein